MPAILLCDARTRHRPLAATRPVHRHFRPTRNSRIIGGWKTTPRDDVQRPPRKATYVIIFQRPSRILMALSPRIPTNRISSQLRPHLAARLRMARKRKRTHENGPRRRRLPRRFDARAVAPGVLWPHAVPRVGSRQRAPHRRLRAAHDARERALPNRLQARRAAPFATRSPRRHGPQETRVPFGTRGHGIPRFQKRRCRA